MGTPESPISYHITHRTSYEYSAPVSSGLNKAYLTPRDYQNQRCLSFKLVIDPHPAVLESRIDFYGNNAYYFTVEEPHSRLVVTAESDVSILPRQMPEPGTTPHWEVARDLIASDLTTAGLETREFTFPSPFVPRASCWSQYARQSFIPGRTILEAALDLTERIYNDFEYLPETTTISTPLEEVWQTRQGVCQDFAHLMLACLRSLGLAARYVSGYLRTIPPPGKPPLVGADASHAWVSVFIPHVGWVDLDPTNNRMVDVDHIVLAWGRDFQDTSPLRGVVLGGGTQTLSVGVDVVPIEGKK